MSNLSKGIKSLKDDKIGRRCFLVTLAGMGTIPFSTSPLMTTGIVLIVIGIVSLILSGEKENKK